MFGSTFDDSRFARFESPIRSSAMTLPEPSNIEPEHRT